MKSLVQTEEPLLDEEAVKLSIIELTFYFQASKEKQTRLKSSYLITVRRLQRTSGCVPSVGRSSKLLILSGNMFLTSSQRSWRKLSGKLSSTTTQQDGRSNEGKIY